MSYPKGLRAEIVRRAREGRSPSELAREFGPSPSAETIRRWIRQDQPTEPRRLVVLHPHLAAQFAPELNPGVDVGSVTVGSRRPVRWRCAAGHVWTAPIRDRTTGSGCPTCAGRHTDSLAVTHPELVAHLVSAVDGSAVDAASLTAGSHQRLRWRCAAGHVWVAAVNQRTQGTGCPTCAGRYAAPLTVTHPGVVAQLAADLNPGVDPGRLTAGSHARLWWRCGAGHEWSSPVNQRTQGTGCPTCAGRFADRLVVTHPQVAAQLDRERNPGVDPEELTAGSPRKLWWRCDAGHGWSAKVNNRTRGAGCPVCAGRFTAPLAVTHPAVAAQLRDPTDADTVTAGSHRRLSWRCERGHVWEAEVRERIRGKAPCPACR